MLCAGSPIIAQAQEQCMNLQFFDVIFLYWVDWGQNLIQGYGQVSLTGTTYWLKIHPFANISNYHKQIHTQYLSSIINSTSFWGVNKFVTSLQNVKEAIAQIRGQCKFTDYMKHTQTPNEKFTLPTCAVRIVFMECYLAHTGKQLLLIPLVNTSSKKRVSIVHTDGISLLDVYMQILNLGIIFFLYCMKTGYI